MSALLRLAMLEQQLGGDAHPGYPDFAGTPPEHHMPVDLCAFAACTAGTYHRSLQTIPAETTLVLLLLDNKLGRCLQALLELQRADKTVVVTPAEAGTMQMADLLDQSGELGDFPAPAGPGGFRSWSAARSSRWRAASHRDDFAARRMGPSGSTSPKPKGSPPPTPGP